MRRLSRFDLVPLTALVGRPERGEFEYVLWIRDEACWVAR